MNRLVYLLAGYGLRRIRLMWSFLADWCAHRAVDTQAAYVACQNAAGFVQALLPGERLWVRIDAEVGDDVGDIGYGFLQNEPLHPDFRMGQRVRLLRCRSPFPPYDTHLEVRTVLGDEPAPYGVAIKCPGCPSCEGGDDVD